MLRRTLLFLFLIAGTVCLAPLSAQTQDAEAAGPVVGDIELRFKGIRNISDDAVMVHVQIREGMVYDQTLVDRSIRSLYATSRFEFIEANVEEMADGQVRLIFLVQPKYRISQIRIVGNRKGKTRRLYNKITSEEGGVLDERKIRKDRDEIYDYYLDKGYTNVDVDYRIDRNDVTGYGTVTFLVDEGRRLKIRSVSFIGNDAVKSKKLRKTIKTKKWSFLSWLLGSGRFNDTTFQEDLDKLRDFYKDKGYLDVNISDSDVTLDYPTRKTIAVTIKVEEGRQYQVGDISIEGNTLFPTAVLMRSLRLRTGDVFSPTKLDEDREALTDFYGFVGYLDTYIRADRVPNLITGAIDLKYRVEEGERVYVESVIIEGNTKTKSVVILRELALAPGDVFNLVRMKNSQARLENTRFFENVNLTPESTNIPGRRNLKIVVQEGRTGQFQFGAGFSSLESGVFFAELSQGNFDLFNWRSFFQGDGQKFRLRFSIGSRSNEFTLAFEEPWLFEKELALGFEFFRRETDYNSTVYNELRTGFEVYIRKRVIGLWVGRLSYRFEKVDIFDVSANASPIIVAESGERTVSKVGLTLTRDTRNHILFPTRGGRTSIISEFAGLGGNTEYVRLQTRMSKFIPTFEFGEQVLAIIGEAGILFETGPDKFIDFGLGDGLEEVNSVPFFDRFFLGGPNDLRGFEYREVGPRDIRTGSLEPIGGNTKGFFSVEYTIKIAEPLRLAAFYDWGYVNEGVADFDPSNYNSNWGFGVRLMVLNNPLRLDFGIPITTDEYNKNDGNQFNFNFGTRF